ncbi:DUF4349 domain-containing protein, partial [Actinomadura sp. KC345]|uniref:DUF4349 domain-containing protein n=1 Tax=Actinomadura sp. KC345 TaxID=2530371 RepID=UPI0014046153
MTWAFIVLLLAGMLAACGGGGDSGSSEPASEQGARATSTGDRGAEGRDEDSGGGDPGAERRPQAPVAEREVVHSAELRVRAGDVDASAAKAKRLVTAAGGYVEKESSRSAPPRSEIALKIPSDRYTALLDQLGTQLGTKLALSQEAEDVTGEVADVEARVRSAEATLTSFRKLFERAGSIDEIIRLEEEISERQSDLEALQARQKSLESRTRFATVTVTLEGESARAEKPEDDGPGGFVDGLRNGWGAFTTFVGGLATVVGWLLPFLVTAAVLGLPVLAFRHRLRDRFGNGGSPAGRAGPAGGGPGPDPEPEKAGVGTAPGPQG